MKDKKNSIRLIHFPFYPADFLSGTLHLSAETIGVYLLLLITQFEQKYLPNNKDKLALIARLPRPRFDKIWDDLSDKFIEIEDKLINERLNEEREKVIKKIDKYSMAGKIGMNKRWGSYNDVNNDVNNDVITNHKPLTNNHKPLSIKQKSKKKDTPAKAGTPQAEFVNNWKDLYKAKTGKEYKADNKDYVLVAKLLKDYSSDIVLEKARLLFDLCVSGEVWFAKSMADFTIGKLSSKWNEIIEEVKNNGKQCGVNKAELEAFLAGRE